MPVTKAPGAKVIAGTLNRTGGFIMRAEKVGRDTMLARIVQMVAAAQRSRAPIQRLADQVQLVRAGGHRGCRRGIRGLGDLWTGTALHLWVGGRRDGSDHCLPMRARAGDAHVDHGRGRSRCAGRRPHQECRSIGADGARRHAGGRQDRHAHRGQAESGGDRCDAGPGGERSAASRRQRGARERAPAGAGDPRGRCRAAASRR